jgi:hypothetical protein
MRCPVYVLLPAVALTCVSLTGCNDQWTEDSYSTTTAAYSAAHPEAPEGRAIAVAPPAATTDYPQGATGPGTATIVPVTTQSDIVSFVDLQLDQVNQLIQDGKLSNASKVLKGIELRRSSWSRATQDAVASKIDAARKQLDAAQEKA